MHLLFDFGRGLVGTLMRSTAVFAQSGESLLLVASPLFAHGESAGSEQPGGGLDTPRAHRSDQTKAMVMGISHFTRLAPQSRHDLPLPLHFQLQNSSEP